MYKQIKHVSDQDLVFESKWNRAPPTKNLPTQNDCGTSSVVNLPTQPSSVGDMIGYPMFQGGLPSLKLAVCT